MELSLGRGDKSYQESCSDVLGIQPCSGAERDQVSRPYAIIPAIDARMVSSFSSRDFQRQHYILSYGTIYNGAIDACLYHGALSDEEDSVAQACERRREFGG